MAQISLKQVASDCMGLTPPFSVIHDFFGYIFGTPARRISLRNQMMRLRGPTYDVNVILVAPENFTAADEANTQYALQFTRDAYNAVGLGIRRLNWQQISAADAGGYATIGSGGEAHDLTDDWNGPAGALDLFVVRVMNGAYGWSAVEGPCDHDDKDEMTGSVVSLNCSPWPAGVICADDIGTTFGHEMGHYLGEGHNGSTANLMGNSSGSVTPGTSALTSAQGNSLRSHCYVHDRC